MFRLSTFVSVLLVTMLLLVGTVTAFAGPPTNTHEVTNEVVTWSLPSGSCETALGGLVGSGQRHSVKHTKANSDGSIVITINDVVKGTAWDSTGSYKFTYENHSVEEIPAGDGAHQIQMEDNFILNGKGIVGHMEVGFNWRWTYAPPANMWPPVDNWQQNSTRGDPLHCDPL